MLQTLLSIYKKITNQRIKAKNTDKVYVNMYEKLILSFIDNTLVQVCQGILYFFTSVYCVSENRLDHWNVQDIYIFSKQTN